MIDIARIEIGTIVKFRNGNIDAIDDVQYFQGQYCVTFVSGNFSTYYDDGTNAVSPDYDIVKKTERKCPFTMPDNKALLETLSAQ
jgi:hypothetical protein